MLGFYDKLCCYFRDNNQYVLKPAIAAFFVGSASKGIYFIITKYCYGGDNVILFGLLSIFSMFVWSLAYVLPASSIKGKHYADAIAFIVVFLLAINYI